MPKKGYTAYGAYGRSDSHIDQQALDGLVGDLVLRHEGHVSGIEQVGGGGDAGGCAEGGVVAWQTSADHTTSVVAAQPERNGQNVSKLLLLLSVERPQLLSGLFCRCGVYIWVCVCCHNPTNKTPCRTRQCNLCQQRDGPILYHRATSRSDTLPPSYILTQGGSLCQQELKIQLYDCCCGGNEGKVDTVLPW